MLKLFNRKTERDKEEEKVEEDAAKQGGGPVGPAKVKKSPGELRMKKEVAELDLPNHAKVDFPEDGNIMKFELQVDLTKEQCLWKGAKYKFTVQVSPNYPHEPPKCHCDTMIYHPNIDLQGNVCLNILRADWKPVLGINAVILGLIFLFIEPNPNDPLNKEAAELMR
jgi:ubiquitin-conjugating enzyme E2 M